MTDPQARATFGGGGQPPPIPPDLIELDQWVKWKNINGRKVPFQPSGETASSNDPSTWVPYERVMGKSKGYAGIGFVFAAEDPFTGIDLDDCLDKRGKLKQWAVPIIDRFADTYMETSPSGTGIKIWCRASLKQAAKFPYAGGGIEVYDRERYFTVTGQVFNGAPRQIEEHQKDVDWLLSLSPKPKGQPDVISAKILKGNQHHTLVSYAGTMRNRGGDFPEINAALQAMNKTRLEEPASEENIRKIAESVCKYPPGKITTDAPPPEVAHPPRQKSRPALVSMDGLEIYNREYSERESIVSGILANGLTILAGRPKSGKSWLTLQIAIANARGLPVLGDHATKQGRVTYLALEEPDSRTHRRLKQLLPDVGADPSIGNIHFIYRILPLLGGGAEMLDEYLAANPSVLVVIDTFLKFVGSRNSKDIMRSDYNEINRLRELAEKHNTAILLVAHSRKAAADYHVDSVAGTSGMTAACDAIWSLIKKPDGATLHVTGREFEDRTLGLRFETGEPFGWHKTGEGDDEQMSESRDDIITLLREEAPLKPADIARRLRKNENTVRRMVQKMYQANQLRRNTDGKYCLTSKDM